MEPAPAPTIDHTEGTNRILTNEKTEKPKNPVVIPRDSKGHFLPGYMPPAAGAGKKPGTVGGRAKTLMLLDRILGEDRIQREMERSLREAILEDPVKFFRTIVMPLLPQDVKIRMAEEGAITWQSLAVAFPMKKAEPAGAPRE